MQPWRVIWVVLWRSRRLESRDSGEHQGLCSVVSYLVFVFFFSSRRRHTRYWRDWSSDVCSSDLAAAARGCAARLPPPRRRPAGRRERGGRHAALVEPVERAEPPGIHLAAARTLRSEERRVGKECRSRWSPYH